MANYDYDVKEGRLIVRDLIADCVTCRQTFEVPVVQVLTLQSGDGCLVLLEYNASRKPTFENLLRVRPDGTVVWRAELPQSHDAFVAVVDRGNRVEAHTWNGFRVEIDLDTGRTKNVRFVK